MRWKSVLICVRARAGCQRQPLERRDEEREEENETHLVALDEDDHLLALLGPAHHAHAPVGPAVPVQPVLGDPPRRAHEPAPPRCEEERAAERGDVRRKVAERRRVGADDAGDEGEREGEGRDGEEERRAARAAWEGRAVVQEDEEGQRVQGHDREEDDGEHARDDANARAAARVHDDRERREENDDESRRAGDGQRLEQAVRERPIEGQSTKELDRRDEACGRGRRGGEGGEGGTSARAWSKLR